MQPSSGWALSGALAALRDRSSTSSCSHRCGAFGIESAAKQFQQNDWTSHMKILVTSASFPIAQVIIAELAFLLQLESPVASRTQD